MRAVSNLFILAIVAALIGIGVIGRMGGLERPRVEAPARAPNAVQPRTPLVPSRPEIGRPLPPPAATDPTVEVGLPAVQQNSTGTAFSLDGRGLWMTARHVADGCTRLFVLTGPREGVRVTAAYIHPNADVAILRTAKSGPPVTFAADLPRVSDLAYHFGFPRGEPGDVQSQLMGRATMRVRGRYATAEPVLVWAERARVPDSDEHLGGISGGPVFDAVGRIVGTTVAGSQRRGRVFTADMASIRAAIERAGVRLPAQGERPRIAPQSFPAAGQALRRQLTVGKVVCLVDQPSPTQPPFGFGITPRGPGGRF
jgi:serine protease Do